MSGVNEHTVLRIIQDLTDMLKINTPKALLRTSWKT